MSIVNCTIAGQIYGWESYNKDNYVTTYDSYAGYNKDFYYAYIIKFTTPTFSGISENITLNLYSSIGVGTNATLRYAICSSDSNKDSYLNVNGAVNDSNQISTGTVTFSDMTSNIVEKSVSIPTISLLPNTDYYLILWNYNIFNRNCI